MQDRSRPAAYIRASRGDADLARHREAVAEGTRQRGWPRPTLYIEKPADVDRGRAPALARLESAIEVGRHDALLITDPGAVTGTSMYLMALLYRCTRNGVTVGFLLPSAPADSDVMSIRRTGKPAPRDALPFPLRRREAWGALARARLGALSELFPDWRIWLDQHGWHARRRESVYLQSIEPGVPAFSVHAETSTELAKQLYWQQAADGDASQRRSAG
ncbi:MAG TPA: recombinase family protein [Streptosporangiaceae bacterium]